jgi:hypothetical protein
MRLLEGFRRKLITLGDEERRELDERQRLLRLLAFRDAFVALAVLSLLQMALQMYFLRGYDIPLKGILALLPMQGIALAALVFFISWRLRGGGFSRGLVAFKMTVFAVSSVIGTLFGWLIVASLARADLVRPPRASSMVVHLIGFGLAIGVIFLLQSRKTPPED